MNGVFGPDPSPSPAASFPAPPPPPPPRPISGSRLMALPAQPNPHPHPQSTPSAPPADELPRGRHLRGERAVYDVDERRPGEVPPQLEVAPITRYNSEPVLALGRRIAVNRRYICYGLKYGAIRVLNINTALRSLLRGHSERVTDMAFFADDVHLLASVSVDGRVYVWKIIEDPDEENKPQITGEVIVAMQMMGYDYSIHPRVCWHSHKQEILFAGIGKCVLKIDMAKVGKGETQPAEEPVKCHLVKLMEGVQLVGKHEGEVTDLSVCHWMTSRLVSASTDGMVIIWEQCRDTCAPPVILRPHDGQPVNAAIFLTSPHHPDHTVLITAGHLNHEVKLWVSSSEDGWLLPNDDKIWKCIQTLELKSSAESRIEDAFFNQVVALPRVGLILLANAKRNAIYAIHMNYGAFPMATRMDYLAEFAVTMPILSLTGTSECIYEGLCKVQVYSVQTQAIQQYALYLYQCLPPPMNPELEADHCIGSSLKHFSMMGSHQESFKPAVEILAASGLPNPAFSGGSEQPTIGEVTISAETKQLCMSVDVDGVHVGSLLPHTLIPRQCGQLFGMQTRSIGFEQSQSDSDHPILERGVDAFHTNVSDNNSSGNSSREVLTKFWQNDFSVVPTSAVPFRQPMHLVTPAEILLAPASSSERPEAQEKVMKNNVESLEVEVNVFCKSGTSQPGGTVTVYDKTEKPIYPLVTGFGRGAAGGSCSSPSKNVKMEPSDQPDGSAIDTEAFESPLISALEGDEPGTTEENFLVSPSQVESSRSAQTGKVEQQKMWKVKAALASGPSSLYAANLTTDPSVSFSASFIETLFSQLMAIRKSLNQVVMVQKEMQKQMSAMMAIPVDEEVRRLESSVSQSVEKIIKANVDAMYAHLLVENYKHEKLTGERVQQITSSITNCMKKDVPALVEKILKKELSAMVLNITRSVTPILKKAVSSEIAESFQRGVSDKAVGQLEKSFSSKVEATIASQLQTQFQTSSKQALQECLRLSLESSVIPAFELSCKEMFKQVDSAFRKGMFEHTIASQQQFDSAHSSLAMALKDALSSATTITQNLNGLRANNQHELLALVTKEANQKAANPSATESSNKALSGFHDTAILAQIEAPLDPKTELEKLISECKFEEAFTKALQRSDVTIVSWLCSQVDLQRIVGAVPPQLGQGVLLSLFQQLACDLDNDTTRKLGWIKDVSVAIFPADPTIAVHVRPIFDQVYQALIHYKCTHPNISLVQARSIQILVHVINSILLSCK